MKKSTLSILVAYLAVATLAPKANSLTQTGFDEVYDFLFQFFKGNKEMPAAVRLAFHDCVGGCDGCLNVNDTNNGGLETIVATLKEIRDLKGWSDPDFGLSNADFWAIAGIAAVNRGIAKTRWENEDPNLVIPDLKVQFHWGRQDCGSSAPYTDEVKEFPSPTMTGQEVLDYYARTDGPGFGFQPDQVVALLGAHTLGRACKENSGYNGPWVAGELQKFDNQFYKEMFDKELTWVPEKIGKKSGADAHWQFKITDADGKRIGMMLNTDFGLLYDLKLNDESRSTCPVSAGAQEKCTRVSTYGKALEYSEDLLKWIDDFSEVFGAMIENGYEKGDLFDLEK